MSNDINMLRETKLGQKGYVKEDVTSFFEELQDKIDRLEKDLRDAEENSNGNGADTKQLESIIDSLNEKLRVSDVTLANERQAHERDRQEFEVKLKKLSGGISPELESKLKEKDELLSQKDDELILMQEKLQQVKDIFIEKDDTITSLEEENTTLKEQIVQIKEEQNNVSSKQVEELNKLNTDLTTEVENLKQENKLLSSKLEELTDSDDLAKAKKLIATVEELNDNVKSLSENEFVSKTMKAILDTANLTAKTQTDTAKTEAESIKAEAEEVKSKALEEADKIITDAKLEADKTIQNAQTEAENIINEAKVSANEKAKSINKKSEDMETTTKDFKSIILSQIGYINESLCSVIELVNSTSEKVSEVKEKVEDNEPLTSLLESLPKAEVEEVSTPEPETSVEEEVKTDETSIQEDITEEVKPNVSQDIDTISVPTLDSLDSIQTEPVKESPKKILDLDDLDDDLSQFMYKPKDTPKDTFNEDYVPHKTQPIKLDGIDDDFLKALEDSLPDETEEEDTTKEVQ